MTRPSRPETEVVLRCSGELGEGRILVIGAPDRASVPELLSEFGGSRLQFLFDDWAMNEAAVSTRGVVVGSSQWGTEWAGPKPDCALIYLPKGKRRLAWWLSRAADAVGEGGQVLVVGAKQAGIKSVARVTREWVGETEKIESMRHCDLLRAVVGADRRREDDAAWWTTFDVSQGEASLRVWALPGVFSADALDDGTRMLLRLLPRAEVRRGLDAGCGAGVIGAMAARLFPESTVDLVDTDAFAIASARRTLAENGVENASVVPGDVLPTNGVRYNRIFSNPPFHRGVVTDTSFMKAFVERAGERMTSSGVAWIVANRFLPYGEMLERGGWQVEMLAEDPQFRVLAARPGSRKTGGGPRR